jgi:hypothetical protein
MNESFGLRMAVSLGAVTPEEYEAVLDYETETPLFSSGREAADHGLAEVDEPTAAAGRVIAKLARKQARR